MNSSTPKSYKRLRTQRGVVTLTASIVLLIVVIIATLYANRVQIFDLKTSANHYRYTQAFEMAEKGSEIAISWLQVRAATPDNQNTTCTAGQPIPITKAVWGCLPGTTSAQCAVDPYEYMNTSAACNSGYPTISATDIGDAQLEANILIRRKRGSIADAYRVEIISEGRTPNYTTSTDPFKSRATVSQAIAMVPFIANPAPVNPEAPILIKGGISNVTGTPDICPDSPTSTAINQGNRQDCSAGSAVTPGVAIATMQATTAGFIDAGNFNTHGGAITALNAPTLTAWEVLFPGLVEADIKAMSEYQYANLPIASRTVFYYGTGSSYGSPPNKISAIGSDSQPVVMVFSSSSYTGSNCPGFGPGAFYGVFYMGNDCDGQGWGNADIYGTLTVEGTLTKLSANTINRYSQLGNLLGNTGKLAAGKTVRIPGSWRDF